jgi:Zn-dependent M28 family amino/carboxypeptidase
MSPRKTLILVAISLTASLLYYCSSGLEHTNSLNSEINAEGFDKHLTSLASDEFLGRGPFSEGEKITVDYLKTEFERIGLEPGNGNSYYQDVPMVQISSTIPEILNAEGKSDIELTYRDEFVAFSQWLDAEVTIENSELVFAGYGVVAPEYGWNDYEDLDVEGKTVMVLVNDPGFGTGDSTFFKGDAMTYYGRWTYKYEEAARQGAAGVLVIHSTIPAGYPWQVVRNSWNGTGLYLRSEDGNKSRCALEGWITMEAAEKIFSKSDTDFSNYRTKAREAGFKAISTGITYSMTIENTWKEDVSKNVVALSPGSTKSDEYIIYSAHWDHFGVGVPNGEDSIYNGALDNATGTAALLEIAEAFVDERSIVFVIVTAEEQGLLGSAYYAQNPIYPLEKSVANLNIDGLYYYGKLKDLTIVGYGQSELDDYAKEAAESQDRYILPDQEASKGYFFRSDHFSFAKVGIPALYASGDYELREGGVELMNEKKYGYNTEHYHLPADEYDPESWDLSSMIEDAQLMFNIGLKLSNDGNWPEWKEGSEFKSIRDSYMKN